MMGAGVNFFDGCGCGCDFATPDPHPPIAIPMEDCSLTKESRHNFVIRHIHIYLLF
jgi:hypothetical protein